MVCDSNMSGISLILGDPPREQEHYLALLLYNKCMYVAFLIVDKLAIRGRQTTNSADSR